MRDHIVLRRKPHAVQESSKARVGMQRINLRINPKSRFRLAPSDEIRISESEQTRTKNSFGWDRLGGKLRPNRKRNPLQNYTRARRGQDSIGQATSRHLSES
jgi:hypothetical protein